MTALSINLPELLTKESTLIAKKLGISRTEFIKQAIVHELENLKRKQAQANIVKSFASMKKSEAYVKQADQIIDGLEDLLPDEEDLWWKKR